MFFMSMGREASRLAWLEDREEEGHRDEGGVRVGGSHRPHGEWLRPSSEKYEKPLEGPAENRDRI